MDFLSTELGCVYFRCIIYIHIQLKTLATNVIIGRIFPKLRLTEQNFMLDLAFGGKKDLFISGLMGKKAILANF